MNSSGGTSVTAQKLQWQRQSKKLRGSLSAPCRFLRGSWEIAWCLIVAATVPDTTRYGMWSTALSEPSHCVLQVSNNHDDDNNE